MYNVTLKCVHATMLLRKSSKYYISECVFIAVLIHHAQCVCCIILLFVAYSGFTTFFHIIS
jgi:hypothetical protein